MQNKITLRLISQNFPWKIRSFYVPLKRNEIVHKPSTSALDRGANVLNLVLQKPLMFLSLLNPIY